MLGKRGGGKGGQFVVLDDKIREEFLVFFVFPPQILDHQKKYEGFAKSVFTLLLLFFSPPRGVSVPCVPEAFALSTALFFVTSTGLKGTSSCFSIFLFCVGWVGETVLHER